MGRWWRQTVPVPRFALATFVGCWAVLVLVIVITVVRR